MFRSLVCALVMLSAFALTAQRRVSPDRVPPKRSSQIKKRIWHQLQLAARSPVLRRKSFRPGTAIP
jgi:hypothetical protein